MIAASDMQFGAKDNLIMPGRSASIDDGWETDRRRGPGYDWAIVKLGTSGTITGIEIDTAPFKGTHPDSASVDGCFTPGATLGVLGSTEWLTVLPQTKLRPNFMAAGGYDGMAAIYEALKKTGGDTNGDKVIAAMKGLKLTSPRGPLTIDPETRNPVQTVYIRKVEKTGGGLYNVEFERLENQKDPVK